MQHGYNNVFKVGAIGGSPIAGATSQLPALGNVQQTGGSNFKNLLSGLANNVNATMAAPTQMMEEHVMHGTHEIHDVMMANSKAELTVNIAAQFTTKIVQAYDKITQIQV